MKGTIRSYLRFGAALGCYLAILALFVLGWIAAAGSGTSTAAFRYAGF